MRYGKQCSMNPRSRPTSAASTPSVPPVRIRVLTLLMVAASSRAASTSTRLDQVEWKVEAATPRGERFIRKERLISVQHGTVELKQLIARDQTEIHYRTLMNSAAPTAVPRHL